MSRQRKAFPKAASKKGIATRAIQQLRGNIQRKRSIKILKDLERGINSTLRRLGRRRGKEQGGR